MPERRYTAADLAYLSTNYASLDRLCDGRAESPSEVEELIAEGLLPRPSYVLDDGTGMFPSDYFRLVDEAGAVQRLQDHFHALHRAASTAHGRAPEAVDEDWPAYLAGTYGICLREVVPDTMVRKAVHVSALCELLMLPRPADPAWQELLRAHVEELDAVEREFAPDYDRADWNERPPTRDLLIRFARHRYPVCFAGEPTPA